MLIKANPDKEGAVNKGLICGKGKWGFDCAMLEDKLEEPLVKEAGMFREADYHEAFVLVAKCAQTIGAKYGKDKIAVAISDRYTNEEAYAIKCMADAMGAKVLCMNNRESGLEKVTGLNASPNTIDELLSTNFILKVGFIPEESRVIDLKIRQAEEAGAQVMSVCGCGGVCEEDACDLTTLKGKRTRRERSLSSGPEQISERHESSCGLYPCKRFKIRYVFLCRYSHLCRTSGQLRA